MIITEIKLRQIIREVIINLNEAVSIEAAEDTAKKNIMKLVKGMIWDMEKSSQLNLPQEQLAWVKEYSPQIIAFVVVEDIVRISLGDRGHFDVDKDYQGDAFKWMYNQLFEKIKTFEFAIRIIANYSEDSTEPIDASILQSYPVVEEVEHGWLKLKRMYSINENYKTIIENYYQMLNFVQPAKRNIQLVADIDELKKLVDDARPRYQESAGRRKKDSNVVQEGTHMLINNDRWWVATIHNASAAYEHAKCSGDENNLTDWCTAAPGTGAKFFKEYYKEDDPLIIFKDKLNKTGYQFSFSSSQFMDAGDEEISDELRYELILLLSTVENKIDERYILIHEAIDTHPLLINDKMNKKPIEQRIISGHLDLENANITSLPDGLKVRGNLSLRGSNIISLPDKFFVGGYLDLRDSKITSLPNGLRVGRTLFLDDNKKITSLPDRLQVGFNLDISRTNITSLPDNLFVGGTFSLHYTNIKSLPAGLHVGWLTLHNTNVTSLPDGLIVDNHLELTDSKVTSLPAGLKVGALYLKDSKITSLPDDLKVRGSIHGFSGDKSKVPPHLIKKLK